jgi:hypothetical protein
MRPIKLKYKWPFGELMLSVKTRLFGEKDVR